MNTPSIIRLNKIDNVVIAMKQLISGTCLEDENLKVIGLIPPGHKIATQNIKVGQEVRRYGQIIGFASQKILSGTHVHTHNLSMAEFNRDYSHSLEVKPTLFIKNPATFQGIIRKNGQIATRNYIGILTSVNCSATVARAIADKFRKDIFPKELEFFPNVDGVIALTHGLGCAIGSESEALTLLQRTLTGYAQHPNFASILIIGLGCETNQISTLLKSAKLQENENLKTFNIQDSGGTTATVNRGVELIRQMLPKANEVKRETVSASNLIIGLQCGGSDGYSGISANPVLGEAVDLLVQNGGTAILSETPEIYGAEHLLTRRAINKEVGIKLVKRIEWWKDYCQRNKAEMNNNPSTGNKAGGLTTILEKSLGAVAKAGTTNMTDVYEYAQTITTKGLVFMDSPGYDPVSATGQVASGANLICFTTGRGSAYGCSPAPSFKLATNTTLWQKQNDDMDMNCGQILEGKSTIKELGNELFQKILETASGKKSKSEIHGYGQQEFVPWQIGSIM